MADKKVAEVMTVAPNFSREQLMTSRRYASRKDLIRALLTDETKTYTCEQVDKTIENYLKGKVI